MTGGLVDFDGDGMVDIVWKDLDTKKSNYYNQIVKWHKNLTGSSGKLKKVISPNGGITKYTYKPLDKTKNQDVKPAMWVVDEVRVCDGITYTDPDTTPLVTKYEYENGVYDIKKKEFRGFGYIKVISPTLDAIETFFRYPFVCIQLQQIEYQLSIFFYFFRF